MARWSRFIRSLPQLSILCLLFINFTTAALPGDAASSLQSNGVICSKGLFGSPAIDTCRRQLFRLPKTDNYQWFESTYDFFPYLLALPGEPCAVDIGILPGARNNVTWKTITSIASTIVETCSATPGAPGGWGVYGTNLPFPYLRGPAMKQGIRLTNLAIHIADIYIFIYEPNNSTAAVKKSGSKDSASGETVDVGSPDNSPPSITGTTAAAAAATTTPAHVAEMSAQEVAYYKGSFWDRTYSFDGKSSLATTFYVSHGSNTYPSQILPPLDLHQIDAFSSGLPLVLCTCL